MNFATLKSLRHAPISSTKALCSSSGQGPFGPCRTRHANGSARPLEITWSISATQPRPLTLPSITNTSVSTAQCVHKSSAYGKKYSSSKMRSLSSHRAKRLTRLSGLVPSGLCVAMWGSGVLLHATMPLMSAARVVKCLATVPVG
jgi:hypothetical protein